MFGCSDEEQTATRNIVKTTGAVTAGAASASPAGRSQRDGVLWWWFPVHDSNRCLATKVMINLECSHSFKSSNAFVPLLIYTCKCFLLKLTWFQQNTRYFTVSLNVVQIMQWTSGADVFVHCGTSAHSAIMNRSDTKRMICISHRIFLSYALLLPLYFS